MFKAPLVFCSCFYLSLLRLPEVYVSTQMRGCRTQAKFSTVEWVHPSRFVRRQSYTDIVLAVVVLIMSSKALLYK